MTARSLLALFDTVYLVALAGWVGGVALFVFGLEPAAKRALDPAGQAALGRAFLPRLYSWAAVVGAVALAAQVCGTLGVPELRGPRAGVASTLLVTGVLAMLHAGNVLVPALLKSLATDPPDAARPIALRKRLRRMNLLVLAIGLVLVGSVAMRPALHTAGIVELSPQIRAERSAAAFQRELERRNKEFMSGVQRAKHIREPNGSDPEQNRAAPPPVPIGQPASEPAPVGASPPGDVSRGRGGLH